MRHNRKANAAFVVQKRLEKRQNGIARRTNEVVKQTNCRPYPYTVYVDRDWDWDRAWLLLSLQHVGRISCCCCFLLSPWYSACICTHIYEYEAKCALRPGQTRLEFAERTELANMDLLDANYTRECTTYRADATNIWEFQAKYLSVLSAHLYSSRWI